ncbi:MAG TPA: Hsp20/alpha crystallin family protein [Bacteroidota bacterium]|nr:Hsp20/alpha crystallin family protein [Bacteroidota bacterium]
MGNNNVALTRRVTSSLAQRVEPFHASVTPVADVYETGDAFVVKLDLPGATKESISISVDPNSLSVRASVQPHHQETASLLHNEIGVKNYQRDFNLGEGIDHNGVKAEFVDGVLTITLPKTEWLKAKEITIS